MSLSFINGDGGHLPPEVTAPTSSQLLADYNALSSPDKAAYRLATAPVHNPDLGNLDALTEEGTMPGDTAAVPEGSGLWRQTGSDYTDPASWTDVIGGEVLPNTDGARQIQGDGGHLPGGTLTGAPAAPSRLLAAWQTMSHAQRAAFRLAIKPAYSSAANQAARLALSNQVPGDYCRQSDLGLLRLRQLPATVDGNWDVLKLS